MERFEFISTKLRMPAPRRDYFIRPQLYKKLDNIPQYKITLVKGSAGSGKTTLLSSFIKERSLGGYRWITLEDEHNNVFSFWYYFLKAVGSCLGENRGDIDSSYQAALQKEDMEHLVALLVNQLDIPDEIIIVLDDFHKIQDEALIQSIEFFIRNSSENIHFVILTREETPLYTGDLAISGNLLEIADEDLKLTADESMLFLKNTLKSGLDPDELKKIQCAAEGWIGGIQLIVLAYAGKKHLSGEIKVLSRQAIDYLSREILDSLQSEEKYFLIRTSVLSYFNAAICNELLEIGNGESIISSFIDRNLFVVQIDDGHGVFRYHTIFGEFLKLQFSHLEQEDKKAFHRKAANLFEKFGDYEECMRHWMLAEDYKEALGRIARFEQGPRGLFLLSRIPLEYVREDRDFAFQKFFYHYCNMEWDVCRELLESIKEKVEQEPSWRAFRFARNFLYDMDLEMEILSFDEIEEMKFSDITKIIIYLKTSAFLHLQDKNREALEFIDRADRLEVRLGNPFIQYFILNMKSQVKEDLGDLAECEEIYRKSLEMIEKHSFLAPLMENYCIGITGLRLKEMALEQAEQSLMKVANYVNDSYLINDIGYLFNLMELKLLKGEKDEAMNLIRKLVVSTAYIKSVYSSSLLKYMLYIGSVDEQLLEVFFSAYEGLDKKYARFDDKVMYAIALHMKGRETEALETIDEVLKSARITKTKFKLIEAILHKISMLGNDLRHNKKEVLNLLREAVYFSFENRILSPYVLAGRGLIKYIDLLREERSEDLGGRERDFIREIRKLLIGRPNDKGQIEKHTADRLLSERETEVLHELATGAQNKEIGERLCISISTVKTHIINIYSKLEVGSRVEAVEKGRMLGLI